MTDDPMPQPAAGGPAPPPPAPAVRNGHYRNPFRPLTGDPAVVKGRLDEPAEIWEPMPSPGEPPEAAHIRHPKHGTPAARWIYRDAKGAPLSLVLRFDLPHGSKEVLPYSYGRRAWTDAKGERHGRTGWHFKAPREPRPLYGLDRLAARPDAPVLLVEGEKAADAAATLFPDFVPIASQGGARAATKADWSALRRRHVTIWPDRDAAGARYAQDAGALIPKAGAASVRIVAVSPEWPEGWDVADPLPEGVTAERLRELLNAARAGIPCSDAPRETDDEAIARLANLPALKYERCRAAEAKRLKIKRLSILDKLVHAARNVENDAPQAGQGRAVRLHEVEPWPDPVRLGDVLNDLQSAIRRHVILSADAAVAVALWIAHTYVYLRFQHSPRLAITSPTKRCGKSTLLAILAATCRRILKADNISPSGVFRTVETLRPLTLLLDEVDAFAKDNEELRGVLNAGFERSGSVIRVVERNDEHIPVQFAVFCPVALAAIGSIPGTLADRAVPVRMERKGAADKLIRLRAADAAETLTTSARKLTRWAADDEYCLGTDPAVPAAMNDREGDICVPLLSIADAAGGEWPSRARRALLALFGLRAEAEDGADAGTLLLADIRDIFAETGATRLPSADLVEKLGRMETRPWSEWKNGKPMTVRQLAAMLKPFRVAPHDLRMPGGSVVKGYIKDDFAEAWTRYLASDTPSAPSPTSAIRYTATSGRNPPFSGDFVSATPESRSGSENGDFSQFPVGCSGVADQNPALGAEWGDDAGEVAL